MRYAFILPAHDCRKQEKDSPTCVLIFRAICSALFSLCWGNVALLGRRSRPGVNPAYTAAIILMMLLLWMIAKMGVLQLLTLMLLARLTHQHIHVYFYVRHRHFFLLLFPHKWHAKYRSKYWPEIFTWTPTGLILECVLAGYVNNLWSSHTFSLIMSYQKPNRTHGYCISRRRPSFSESAL